MTLISHSLGQIRDLIPPKLKEQWSRLPANTTLIAGAIIVTLGIGYLGYRFATQSPLSLSDKTIENVPTMDTVKRVAEALPIAPGEGRIVSIEEQEFLVVKEENSALDIYSLAKVRPLGAEGKVSQLFSLQHNNWGMVMKTPRKGESSKKIENGMSLVKLVNPDGKTRGCITVPYLVTHNNTKGKTVVQGTLMRVYESDAALASGPHGIIDRLRKEPDSEPYFVDMVHQALSILAKLQEMGIAHNDIRAANVFVSRNKEGFIDFHLGDWDEALLSRMQRLHARDVHNMGKLLYEQITGKAHISKAALPPHLQNIIPPMLREECDIGQLLNQLNQSLAWAAKPDAPPIWQHVARRAGLIPIPTNNFIL